MTDGLTSLAPFHPPADNNAVSQAVSDALSSLGGADPRLIVVNDTFRHTDTPAVLKELADSADCRQARLIVAAGTHTAAPREQKQFEASLRKAMKFGELSWHDSRNPNLVEIGGPGSWLGHPWLVGDDGLIAIGSVEPHYFAGFTGAHKTATIGCCGVDDISANHASAISDDCRPCRLAGNPVYGAIECMLAGLESIRPVAVVNLVQIGKTIVGARGGQALPSLQEAGLIAMQAFVRRIDAPADAIVAEVTGALSRNFYQAEKGVKNNEWALRDGGLIVLDAACPQGIGTDPAAQQFIELLAASSTGDEAMASVRQAGYKLGDHKAVRLRKLLDPTGRNVRLIVVSPGLDAKALNALGIGWARSVEDALAAAGVDPSRQHVYHLQDAGNMCLMLTDSPVAAPNSI